MVFFIIYGLFIYYFIPIATNPWSQIRFRVTNDLNIEQYTRESADKILQEEERGVELVHKIFHNRRLAILNYENVKKITRNYLLHFSPEFLFVEGDAPLHHAPDFGMMYFFDLPLLVLGIIYFIKKLRNRKNLVLLIWLFVAPLPAAVTWQAPHSVRGEIILPTLQIISAIGMVGFFKFIRIEGRILARLSAIFVTFIFVFAYAQVHLSAMGCPGQGFLVFWTIIM